MKRGCKARPHDIDQVIEIFKPELIEIHASSEDLKKEFNKDYDLPLVVHLPEYDQSELIDVASLDEKKRIQAVKFYNNAMNVTRNWSKRFRGTPKSVLHPGGISIEPTNALQKREMYEQLGKSLSEINSLGVDLLLENMPPNPVFFGGSWKCNIFLAPRDCIDFCSGLGYGFVFDTSHAGMFCNSVENEIDIMKFATMVRPVTAHIHLNDCRDVDQEGLALDSGTLDWRSVIRYFESMPIGVVSECWNGHKDSCRGFIEDWKKVDEALKKETVEG